MKKLTTRQIALNGVVAGLYAAITILTASFAYGNIQFRIADSLCVLVVLEPSLTVGLTLGCLISNIFSTVSALDIVIGTAGTLLGCLLAARVKKDWLVPVPVILANAVLVGAMLAYVLTPDALVQGFFINGGEVLLGEAVVLYLLGVPAAAVFPALGADGKAPARRPSFPALKTSAASCHSMTGGGGLHLQIFRVVIVEIPVAAGLALDEDERDREQNGHERGEQPAVVDGLDRCDIVVAAVQERRQKQGQHPAELGRAVLSLSVQALGKSVPHAHEHTEAGVAGTAVTARTSAVDSPYMST